MYRALRAVGAGTAAVRSVVAPSVARVGGVVGVAGLRLASTYGSVVDGLTASQSAKETVSAPSQEVAWDASEFKTHVDALARGLLELGYGKGHKLAVWMGNDAEHLCAHFAAAKTGITIVSLDPELSVAAVGEVLKSEGCRGLMYTERFGGKARSDALKDLFPELDNARWGDQIRSKNFRGLKHLITTGFEAAPGITQYGEFVVYGETADPVPAAAAAVGEDDVAVVSYGVGGDADTAVQTGSKTHKDLVAGAQDAAAAMKLTSADVLLLTAPLHTPTGFIGGALAAAVSGAQIVIPSKEFDADLASSTLAKSNATAVCASAPQLSALPEAGSLKTAPSL